MDLKGTRHKIIVGIDLGTTYSGAAFACTAQKTIQSTTDINLIRDWPGKAKASDEVSKTPSRIAFAQENHHYEQDRWGYEVMPRMISCAWFKLLLDSHVEITDFDDSELETLAKSEGDGMYRLPQGMTAEEVTAAYLTPFYRHVMGHLEKRFSADMLQSMQIEYYFTVPALWSDRAKAATRSAAMTAGFASRTGDTIFMIPEPEAAAVAALKSLAEGSSGQSQLKPNTAVMIVDCGGGTVDLSTYKITQVYPTLKFEELIPGIGGKCGSVWIERRFHTWMSQVFPGHWEKVSFEKKGPGSPFMKEFEIQKRDFGSSTDPNQEFEVALVMPDVEENRYYDASECMVKFYRGDMLEFFRPAIDRTKRLMQQQLDQAKLTSPDCPVTLAVLVGGFGDSPHLNRELKDWCAETGDIRLICPEKPQAAIVRGATLRGLEGIKPQSRRCRRAYGFSCGKTFRWGEDKETDAYTCEWSGQKYCRGRMDWQISKGQKIEEHTVISTGVMHTYTEGESLTNSCTKLYSCDIDILPESCNDPWAKHIGTIALDFGAVDPKMIQSKRKNGKKVFRIDTEMEVLLGKAAGVLCFRAMCGGREIGTADINYSD